MLPFDFLLSPTWSVIIGVVVAFACFGDRKRIVSRRNAALLCLFLPAVFLWRILQVPFEARPRLAGALWLGAFLSTAFMSAWGFALARSATARPAWSPNLSRRALQVLTALILLLDVLVVLGRRPDDAGIFSNLGAQRWIETGRLPYADSTLKGPDAIAYGAAATYGPLLYLSHFPARVVTGAPVNPADVIPRPGNAAYRHPPHATTQLTCLAFFLLGVAALFGVARRHAGVDTALGIVAVYAASPYVLGLGGQRFVITGLAYISHIAPAAVMLAALWAARRPALSGGLFVASAGVLFFPAFLFPSWLGWWWRRHGRRAWHFVGGYAIVGLLILVLVVASTPSVDGKGPVGLFLESTLEHQEGTGTREYGRSTDSFWGTHPTVAAFWQRPLTSGTSLLKPTFLLFAFAALLSAWWVRARSLMHLAAITAALGAGIQLWKTHATGSYVEWYFPFLLLALIVGTDDRSDGAPEDSA